MKSMIPILQHSHAESCYYSLGMKSHHDMNTLSVMLPEAEVVMIHTEADQEVNGDSRNDRKQFFLYGETNQKILFHSSVHFVG